MLQVSTNNIVTMTRGDTVSIPLDLFYNVEDRLYNSPYYINVYDKVAFAIMEPNQRFEDAIVKKIYTYDDLQSDGTINVNLISADTEFLLPGDYYYTVKILKKSVEEPTADSTGSVETVIQKTRFTIVD